MDKELNEAISQSRRDRESKRVKFKRDNRGRPHKTSGIYYNKQLGISAKTMLLIRRNRLPQEPLGATLDRLLGMAGQKKVVAPIERYDLRLAPIQDIDTNKVFEEWQKSWRMRGCPR